MARIIPVIDVLGGRVVRAVGGRRSEYRPIRSRLTDSTDPTAVAAALLGMTAATDLYVADLDAITSSDPILSPNTEVIGQLTRQSAAVWVDYGHRDDFDEATLMGVGVTNFVLGTETIAGLHTLFHTSLMVGDYGSVMLSVDLRNGRLRCRPEGWAGADPASPVEVVAEAVRFDIRRVLVLDLEPVGQRDGPTTADLCRTIRTAHPSITLWTGGGVRDWDDVKRLEDAGADGVLVASALHDGTLTFPRPAS